MRQRKKLSNAARWHRLRHDFAWPLSQDSPSARVNAGHWENGSCAGRGLPVHRGLVGADCPLAFLSAEFVEIGVSSKPFTLAMVFMHPSL